MFRFDYTLNLWSGRNPLEIATPKADHALAVQVAKDTEPFVPALTGSLKNRTQVEGGTITYQGPYARYLYYGKLMVDPATGSPWASKGAHKVLTDRNLVFNTSMHSQAQSHWFEVSKALNEDRWLDIYRKAVDQELGRRTE